MIEPESIEALGRDLRAEMGEGCAVLNELRAQVRPLLPATRRIQPRSTTAISLVGTDGGNNRIEFDPFMVQLIRVVDSSRNEYCLEVITPDSDRAVVSRRHLDEEGSPRTALGRMMERLGVRNLWELSPMIQRPGREPRPSWVQVYRELTEWAVLLSIVTEKDFGTDTVIVCDGFLRSKVFAGELFRRYREELEKAIEEQRKENRRRIFIAGIAKHSKVLQKYRLAMALEGVMRHPWPCYVEVPFEMEKAAYRWSEYARGDEQAVGGEANKFVAGKMFFVKFGDRPRDPVWPVDLLLTQKDEAQEILGYMLADAIDGFPVPFYPLCLQRAHEHAALVGFDMDVLQREIMEAIRESLGSQAPLLDEIRLEDADPSQRRYW